MLVFPSEEGAVGRSYTMCVSVYWGGGTVGMGGWVCTGLYIPGPQAQPHRLLSTEGAQMEI